MEFLYINLNDNNNNSVLVVISVVWNKLLLRLVQCFYGDYFKRKLFDIPQ